MVLGRHHILDVVAGVLIGLLEAVILSMVWRDEEQAASMINMFGGEDPWSSAKDFKLCLLIPNYVEDGIVLRKYLY